MTIYDSWPPSKPWRDALLKYRPADWQTSLGSSTVPPLQKTFRKSIVPKRFNTELLHNNRICNNYFVKSYTQIRPHSTQDICSIRPLIFRFQSFSNRRVLTILVFQLLNVVNSLPLLVWSVALGLRRFCNGECWKRGGPVRTWNYRVERLLIHKWPMHSGKKE